MPLKNFTVRKNDPTNTMIQILFRAKNKRELTIENLTVTLEEKTDDVVQVVCKQLRIDQEFLKDDVCQLLLEIPDMKN